MCGICGIIDLSNSLSRSDTQQTVRAMNRAILHRGPDESGEYQGDNFALAMRRLSIIDIAGGQQPIFNESGQIGVFFNGEIYNFPDLKAELIEKGHQFQTHSDTEVLVHLYETYGEKMLPLLKGMFAFCLFDLSKKTFFLARDRFGEKPLFYHFDKQVFSFSSEINSLLCHKNIPRQLNHDALPYYLRTSLLPEDMTLLKGIACLPAGHFIKISESKIQIKKYFSIDYKINTDIQSEGDAIELIKPLLENAVQRQMVSDVPIGAFLSGGIDSSTVVALLQKNISTPIQTFTVRFENQAYDESAIARKVAAYWGTRHHEITIPNYDFSEDIFWNIIDHIGQPFRDSSAIPSFLIAKEIRQHVKVALSGDGGDELFGGYELFQWYQKIMKLRQIPRPLRQMGQGIAQFAQQLPLLERFSAIRQIERGIRTTLEDLDDIPIALNAFFSEAEIQRLLNRRQTLDFGGLKAYPSHIDSGSPLRKIMYYRTHHTLPGNMLVKIDRMSMANSLEVRAPFLDPDLFEAAATLPDKFLISQGKGKYLLRKIMENELPTEVFNHPKTGFNIPLHEYQNDAFRKLAHRLFFEENPFPGLLNEAYLKEIFDTGLSTQKHSARKSVFQATHQLWMLMQLFGWGQRFHILA